MNSLFYHAIFSELSCSNRPFKFFPEYLSTGFPYNQPITMQCKQSAYCDWLKLVPHVSRKNKNELIYVILD